MTLWRRLTARNVERRESVDIERQQRERVSIERLSGIAGRQREVNPERIRAIFYYYKEQKRANKKWEKVFENSERNDEVKEAALMAAF